ncbi:MAG: glycosyltransferase [Verrucomicrobia bacterium]|nr:glycosyltransferase [Verrucomicrobiota bacterium]
MLYFVDSIGFGGAERFLCFFLREAVLRRKQVDATLVYFYKAEKPIHFAGVSLKFVPASGIIFRIQQLAALRSLIRKADLIHTQLSFSTLLFRFLNLGIGKPSVTTLQNIFYDYKNLLIYPLLGRLKLLMLNLFNILLKRDSDEIVAISKAVSQSFSNFSGVPVAKISIVSNCIDPRFFSKGPHELWRGFKKILCIGRLVPEKNFFLVLEALSIIKKNGVGNFPAVFLGSGPLKSSLQIFAKTQGIPLYTPGVQEDVFHFLKFAREYLFIHPSLSEGQGLVVLEAMAACKPCLLSDIPAHREVAGKGALYFNPKSAQDLANKILLLDSNYKLGRRLTKLGMNRCVKASPEVVCKKYLRIYQKTISLKH